MLHMCTLDCDPQVVRVSFYLGRLRVLSRCELEVARFASAGHSNTAIAALRQTSIHTVARQVSSALAKLSLGSRLGLATIAELDAWAPPHPVPPANGNGAAGSWLKADGIGVQPHEAARIWREVALGQWTPFASIDIGAVSHVAMRLAPSTTVRWEALSMRERGLLGLMAQGFAQKVVAMKLGLAPSTVSGALQAALRRLGVASLARLLRGYCALRDVLESGELGTSLG